jgi:hypothetical protein
MDPLDDLEELGERRTDIGMALSRLEEALARPIGSRHEWRARVDLALDELLIVGRIQTSALLAPGGPLEEAVRSAPRLSGQVDRLRQGMPAIEEEAEDLQKRLGELEPVEIRRLLVRLLGRVVGHRHLLADTIWEAYNVDIGGPG